MPVDLQTERLRSFAGIVALAGADLTPDQIDRVFLTGGSSFAPAVHDVRHTVRQGEDRNEGR